MPSKKTPIPSTELDVPKSYKGIYAMHKYWSKKPFNLVANYIARFTDTGHIVLDSFCGSGVTLVESVRLGRKSIGFDINPIATFITRVSLEHIDIERLKQAYQAISERVKTEVNALYQTHCPRCGDEYATATHFIWEGDVMQEVWVTCHSCNTRKVIKAADDLDRQQANSFDKLELWHPQNPLFENTRINAKKGMTTADLFTNRALFALSMILGEIEKIDDIAIQDTLRLCFTAALPQASRMVFVIRRHGNQQNGHDTVRQKAEVGSWVIGYWMPKEHFEINVWRCFDNRFKRILRGKKEINRTIPINSAPCSKLEDLYNADTGYYIDTVSATSLPIDSNTIDYIFTDPPHGNRIPYLELSLMWNTWLKFDDVQWDDEIIISEAKVRNKDKQDYQQRVYIAFKELWRVLKPGKYASIVFNSLDDDSWLAILNACLQAGFQLYEITPLAYSAHSVVQDNRKNALKTDFVITCQKQSSSEKQESIQLDDGQDVETLINDYLASTEEQTQTYNVLNYIIIQQALKNRYISISKIIDTLEQNFIYINSSWRRKSE